MRKGFIAALAWFDPGRWEDVDHDAGWTLRECRWTGRRKTAAHARNLRAINLARRPRWERGQLSA